MYIYIYIYMYIYIYIYIIIFFTHILQITWKFSSPIEASLLGHDSCSTAREHTTPALIYGPCTQNHCLCVVGRRWPLKITARAV